MLTNLKIALSVALVLATASAAIAAPKHKAVRHQTAIERQVPAGTYLSFGAVRTNTATEPSYMKIQDIGFSNYN
jgi:hypothetical protein